jgi:hypothetical protein
MGTLKLNHDKIKQLIQFKGITVSALGRKLGLSRQMAHYILKEGGPGYAPRLAEVLECEVNDLLLPESPPNLIMPKGFGILDNRVIRT